MPVTFCEAIVTTNSGRARPSSAPASNVGAVNVRAGSTSTGGGGLARVDRDRDGRDGERAGHRPAAGHPHQHHPGGDHRQRLGGKVDRGLDRRQADREEDARQHRAGQRGRDRLDPAPERAPQAGDDDQHAGDGEGAERGRVAAGDLAARDEQGGAGRGPGDRDRLAVAEAEPDRDHGHREAERRQAGGGLGLARADRAQARQHERERAREADERGDDAGDRRLRGAGPGPHPSAAAVGYSIQHSARASSSAV